MKRLICIVMACIFAVPLCACTGRSQQSTSTVNFYYRTQATHYSDDNGVICAEIRNGSDNTTDLPLLVEEYLNGPITENCVSPFPDGIDLIEINYLKGKVQIVLSSHLALLTGAELAIACTCLAKTVLEITGEKSVEIRAHDSLLDNRESITLKADSFVLFDDYAEYAAG